MSMSTRRARQIRFVMGALAAGAVAGTVARVLRERRRVEEPWAQDWSGEPMGMPAAADSGIAGAMSADAGAVPVAQAAVVGAGRPRRGSATDRGRGGSVRLDLSRAQQGGLEPVVEFLTFLQQKRGDDGHLLFVRYDDLDALAEQQGEDSAEFLSRLDQLGVVVSNN